MVKWWFTVCQTGYYASKNHREAKGNPTPFNFRESMMMTFTCDLGNTHI